MAKDKSIPSNIILAKEKFKYDTIQDMVNDIALKVGMVVDINGYYKPDDGATHKRVIADNDDGSGVQLRSGKWANIVHNGEVNVSWFGAKGNGIDDDTQAIQKAVLVCDILIFGSNHLITNSINVKNKKKFLVKGNDTTIFLTNGSFCFCVENTVEFKAYNMKLDFSKFIAKGETGYEAVNGLFIKNSDYVDVKNIIVTKYKNLNEETSFYGLNLQNNENTLYSIENCSFEELYCRGNGIVGDSVGAIRGILINRIYGTKGNTLIGNGTIKNCYFSNINNMNVSGSYYKEDADGIHIANAYFVNQENTIKNLRYSDGNCIIRDCFFYNCGKRCIKIQANKCVVLNIFTKDDENVTRSEFMYICGSNHYVNNLKGEYKNSIIISGTYTTDSDFYNIKINGNSKIDSDRANRSYFYLEFFSNIRIYNSFLSYDLGLLEVANNELIETKRNIIFKNCDITTQILYRQAGSQFPLNDIQFENCNISISQSNISNEQKFDFKKCTINIDDKELREIKAFLLIREIFDCVIISNKKGNFMLEVNKIAKKLLINSNDEVYAVFLLRDNTVIEDIKIQTKNNLPNVFYTEENNIKFKNIDITNINCSYMFRLQLRDGGEYTIQNIRSNNNLISWNGLHSGENVKLYVDNIFGKNYSHKNVDVINLYDNNIVVASPVQLDTPYYATKMQQDGVYNDFISYMDEKTLYDKQQEKLEQDRQLAYEEALKENPELTYEEFMSVQPMTLNLVEEPQPSENLKKFMEKYL